MNDQTPLEVLTPSALGTLERASIDVQVSTAHAYPRSIALFKQRAMEMVQQDLETAESCIYSRPVGKGEDGKQKYAEGASIRMAEIVAACYGNIRVGARIIEQTERYVKAEGVAHDLETNYAAKSEAMESTLKRNGHPYDERMRIVVAKACLSKALRDAIFRVCPKALCKSITEAAMQVIQKQAKTIEQRRDAAKKWLAAIKVDESCAFAVMEVKGWPEVGEVQLLQLTGLKTAMHDQEITIDEAFPYIASTNKPSVPAGSPAPSAPAKTQEAVKTAPAATREATTAPVEQANSEPAQESQPAGEPANSAEPVNQAQQPAAAPLTGTPIENCKAAMTAAGLTEPQVMRYLQGLKPALARGSQTALAQLADAKLTNIATMLQTPAVIEAVKAVAV